MQGIRILQSWNCVLEDCKTAKIIDIAMLRCWEKAGKRRYQGGEKLSRPLGRYAVQRTASPPGRAQNLLAGCIFVGEADKSAFALLSQKVTKEGLRPDTSRTTNVREGSIIMHRIRHSLPDREKGKFIETDNQRYDRERLFQP